MKAFFDKYEVKLDQGDAIKVIECQAHEAKKAYKENPKSEKYLRELAKIHCMVEDFFEANELEVDSYYE